MVPCRRRYLCPDTLRFVFTKSPENTMSQNEYEAAPARNQDEQPERTFVQSLIYWTGWSAVSIAVIFLVIGFAVRTVLNAYK